MPEPTATTQTVTAADAPRQWRDILDRVSHSTTRVIVEEDGIPVAAVISADDLRRLTALDAERAEALAALTAFGERFKDVPEDEIEREVTRAIGEVRAENRNADNQAPAHSA